MGEVSSWRSVHISWKYFYLVYMNLSQQTTFITNVSMIMYFFPKSYTHMLQIKLMND